MLEGIQAEFNSKASGGMKVSIADLIVLGGAAGVEKDRELANADRPLRQLPRSAAN